MPVREMEKRAKSSVMVHEGKRNERDARRVVYILPFAKTCSRTGERVSQLFAAGAAPVLGTVNEHPGHE